jgi:hypothetical protein
MPRVTHEPDQNLGSVTTMAGPSGLPPRTLIPTTYGSWVPPRKRSICGLEAVWSGTGMYSLDDVETEEQLSIGILYAGQSDTRSFE